MVRSKAKSGCFSYFVGTEINRLGEEDRNVLGWAIGDDSDDDFKAQYQPRNVELSEDDRNLDFQDIQAVPSVEVDKSSLPVRKRAIVKWLLIFLCMLSSSIVIQFAITERSSEIVHSFPPNSSKRNGVGKSEHLLLEILRNDLSSIRPFVKVMLVVS